jgi:prepilin-type processing-associated H-X9-DG protein
VLMSMLLPVVTAAKRQSRRTACEARLRVIGQALQIYLGENNDTLPQACSTNSLDSTESRAGGWALKLYSDRVQDHFLPPPIAGPSDPSVEFVGPPGFTLPLAPMPYFLRKGAPVSDKVWSCPAIRNGFAGLARTYQYVETGRSDSDPNLLSDTSGPLAGTGGANGEWRPGYQYMCGAEYWWSLMSGKDPINSAVYHYAQFATRNIGGLKLDEIKPDGGQGSSGVVTFADYSVMAHSKETDDMWNADLWKRMGNYSANFLYLDGHVEYHEFTSVAGYFRVLHGPIPQTWGSVKFQDVLNVPDVWKQPSGSAGGT